MAWSNLGDVARAAGDLTGAVAQYEHSLEVYRGIDDDRDPREVECFLNRDPIFNFVRASPDAARAIQDQVDARIDAAVSRAETSVSHRGSNVTRSKASTFSRIVRSPPAPPST